MFHSAWVRVLWVDFAWVWVVGVPLRELLGALDERERVRMNTRVRANPRGVETGCARTLAECKQGRANPCGVRGVTVTQPQLRIRRVTAVADVTMA